MKLKFSGFLLVLLSISAFAQSDLEKCQQRNCYGFGPPSGQSQNGHIFQDLTKNPPDLYCAVGGTWRKCGSGTGNPSGNPQAITRFGLDGNIAGDGLATEDTSGNISTPGGLTSGSVSTGSVASKTTNNVAQACGYPGATLDAKIAAAEAAWSGIPVEIDVTKACSSLDIVNAVIMQDSHSLRLTQGVTVNLFNQLIPGSNSEISGLGDSTIFKLMPSAGNTSTIRIDNVFGGAQHDIKIHDALIDANADAFIAAGMAAINNRPIQITANNGGISGPYNITVHDVHIKNTMKEAINAGGGSLAATTSNIKIIHNLIENSYEYSIRANSFLNNYTVAHNTIQGYERVFPVTVTAATASGTTATLTISAGMPDTFETGSGSFIQVTGCVDTHYNTAFGNFTRPNFSTGGTTITYTIPTGAAGSTSGCSASIQNAQAPIRGELYADNYNWTFDGNILDNTFLAREFGIELFGGAPSNIYLHGAQIINERHNARGVNGGTGFSIVGEKFVLANNQLINGTGNSIGVGCECSIIDSTVTGDVVEGGSYAFNRSGSSTLYKGVSASNLTFVGPITGSSEGALEVNMDNSTFTNITIDMKQSGGGTGVAIGHSGGQQHAANVELNNINVFGQASLPGAPSQCFVIDGDSTSQNIRINGGSCSGVEVGINTAPGAQASNIVLRDIDLSNVLTGAGTAYLNLRSIQGVMETGIKFAAAYPTDTDQTGRNVYGALSVLPMQANGTTGVLVVGTAGATTYNYSCVGVFGTTIFSPAATGGVVNGNATLSGTNYNQVICPVFLGATKTNIYRTTGGATQGMIASVNNNAASVNDTGLAASGSVPVANNLPNFVLGATTITGLDGTTITTDANGNLKTGAAVGNTNSTSLTTNKLPKANGANSIVDSSISDNGTKVTFALPVQFSGSGIPIATGTASNNDLGGFLTLSGGTATYTFTATYATAPICVVSETTNNANGVKGVATTTVLTITGTGTDVIAYICIGRT